MHWDLLAMGLQAALELSAVKMFQTPAAPVVLGQVVAVESLAQRKWCHPLYGQGSE